MPLQAACRCLCLSSEPHKQASISAKALADVAQITRLEEKVKMFQAIIHENDSVRPASLLHWQSC